jgi:excisionase family DNA binding protein
MVQWRFLPVGAAERNKRKIWRSVITSNARFVFWRGESNMLTRKMQDSQISQVRLLTVQEVAEWAKVSTKTVYRWISDKKIPAIRFGSRTYRISEKDLINYLENTGYYFLIE